VLSKEIKNLAQLQVQCKNFLQGSYSSGDELYILKKKILKISNANSVDSIVYRNIELQI
jgi:hypothetical protein